MIYTFWLKPVAICLPFGQNGQHAFEMYIYVNTRSMFYTLLRSFDAIIHLLPKVLNDCEPQISAGNYIDVLVMFESLNPA